MKTFFLDIRISIAGWNLCRRHLDSQMEHSLVSVAEMFPFGFTWNLGKYFQEMYVFLNKYCRLFTTKRFYVALSLRCF